ncbi:MAG: hypothetical protein EA411_08030 [Saprospirales bacterium]|nr:MAG: hypothetical protein EA411_08030 [Saprospirales bacterium]
MHQFILKGGVGWVDTFQQGSACSGFLIKGGQYLPDCQKNQSEKLLDLGGQLASVYPAGAFPDIELSTV